MTVIGSTLPTVTAAPRNAGMKPAGTVSPSGGGAVSSAPASIVSLSSAATATLPDSGARKDFATVAKDARASMDAGYQKLGKTGDIYSTEADWNTAFSGLDRRSLYAVASNEGGQFSQAEQWGAQYFMDKQVNTAMGVDNPAVAANPTSSNFLAGIRFLDSVSDEEKTSMTWAEKRAGLQFSYEVRSEREGKAAEDVESDSPLVKLIKGGLDNLRRTDNPANQLQDTPEYKQAVQLAEQMKAARTQAAGIKDKDGGA